MAISWPQKVIETKEVAGSGYKVSLQNVREWQILACSEGIFHGFGHLVFGSFL